jgi:hypothetical protein
MDIGSIFLVLAILIPVAIFISRPLMERSSIPDTQTDQDLSTLLAERDQVVATLKELDDDFNLGKIPADIYPSQRLSLLQNGAEILRQIDAIQSTPSTVTAEDQLEAAIVAHRLASDSANTPLRKNGNAVPPVPDDDLEQRIASRRRLKAGKAGGFCPKCGKPVQATDRFCPKCGATLV